MKKQITGHQGDVQFRTVKSIPKEAKSISFKPLALGEHSGHQHILTGDVQLFEVDNTIFAQIGKGKGRLQHIHESNFKDSMLGSIKEIEKADHDSILLEEGCYEFWIQNQYNPLGKVFEKVVD